MSTKRKRRKFWKRLKPLLWIAGGEYLAGVLCRVVKGPVRNPLPPTAPPPAEPQLTVTIWGASHEDLHGTSTSSASAAVTSERVTR